jgi:hypothetical protein
MTRWFFIVDTEQYSGNFEREMGSYLIGMVGPYFSETAEKLAQAYRDETGDDGDESQFADILSIHDGDGEHEPSWVAIWPTPGWYNDGQGRHLKVDAPVLEGHHIVGRYPAYQSVAIAFDKKPTNAQLQLLRTRAEAFPEAFRTTIPSYFGHRDVKVTGCRLVKEKTKRTHQEIPL